LPARGASSLAASHPPDRLRSPSCARSPHLARPLLRTSDLSLVSVATSASVLGRVLSPEASSQSRITSSVLPVQHSLEISEEHSLEISEEHSLEISEEHSLEISEEHSLEISEEHSLEISKEHSLEISKEHSLELPRTRTGIRAESPTGISTGHGLGHTPPERRSTHDHHVFEPVLSFAGY
jgi:hypothetical protein